MDGGSSDAQLPTKHVFRFIWQQRGDIATAEAGATLCGVAPSELHADAIDHHVVTPGCPGLLLYVVQAEVT